MVSHWQVTKLGLEVTRDQDLSEWFETICIWLASNLLFTFALI